MCKPTPARLPFFIERRISIFNGGQHKAEADCDAVSRRRLRRIVRDGEIDYHDPGFNENADYRSASQSRGDVFPRRHLSRLATT
jgi:hypothetical protein